MSDPARVATREDFGRELSLLRQETDLTVRALAARVGVPPSTLGGYFTGRHLPRPGSVIFHGVLRACGVDESQAMAWVQALRRARRTAGPGPAPAPVVDPAVVPTPQLTGGFGVIVQPCWPAHRANAADAAKQGQKGVHSPPRLRDPARCRYWRAPLAVATARNTVNRAATPAKQSRP